MDILILLVVIGTTIWVYFDAKALGVEKGKISGALDNSVAIWVLGCLALWIVAFPAYLVARGQYQKLNN